MICANCKKEITLCFGKSGLNGCYCEVCAEKLGFFPKVEIRPKTIQAQMPGEYIIKHIGCDISQAFIDEIDKIIELLDFSIAINSNKITISGEKIPLLLNALKKLRGKK